MRGAIFRSLHRNGDDRRTRDLTQARLHKLSAESRLRNLYKPVADAKASVREPVFANILAETNALVASAAASFETLERRIGKAAKAVTPATVEALATLFASDASDISGKDRHIWRYQIAPTSS